MRRKLKPLLAVSIVLVGMVFIKLGNTDDIWRFLVLWLGAIVVLIPAFYWYYDKLNM